MFSPTVSAPRHYCLSCSADFGSFIDLQMHVVDNEYRLTPVMPEDRDEDYVLIW